MTMCKSDGDDRRVGVEEKLSCYYYYRIVSRVRGQQTCPSKKIKKGETRVISTVCTNKLLTAAWYGYNVAASSILYIITIKKSY
jgi:hypothetical protein